MDLDCMVSLVKRERLEEEFHLDSQMDPSDSGLVLGLSGKFWADSFVLELDCEMVEETAVYAILDYTQKNILWNALRKLASSISDPWVLIGDLNYVTSSLERTGGFGAYIDQMSLFSDRIDQCKVSDLGEVGPCFTWKGPRLRGGRRLYERLDRAMANEVSREEFLENMRRVRGVAIVKQAGRWWSNSVDSPPRLETP
ncbi:hypothetical protein K1719_000213 [Acacia pycnantha]|nr:hypothetical protein K1719_000213 [Acacia pycnantha]